MKIESIKATPFSLPVRRNFRWAGLLQDLGHLVALRIRTKCGIVGYGEAVPLPDWGGDHARRAGETRKTVCAIIADKLAPALIGEDPRRVAHIQGIMDCLVKGHSYAKCAVEMALYDILGKSLNTPIHDLLGGRTRDSVRIAHMIGLMPIKDALDEGESAVADGIRALQIKGGEDSARDIEVCTVLRRNLGPDITLRLDINQGYRNAKAALKVLAPLEGIIDFVEQPAEGLDQMARVTAGTGIPVIADESCWTPRDALDLVERYGSDCVSIYLAKAGGMLPALGVSFIAAAAGKACDVNGSIESAIGNLANVQFAISAASVTLPAVIPISAPRGTHPCAVGGRYFEDDILTEPMVVKDGAIQAPTGPGLGIEIDEEKLRRFAE